jgi:nicotinamidase-related amidase
VKRVAPCDGFVSVPSALPPAVYVPRKGAVNALDDEDFVKTIRATGRKTLIMAGVWTDVCVMFPALDARWQGSRCTP